MKFSGIIASVNRLDFAAKADRPASTAIAVAFDGADDQARLTRYELLTRDPSVVAKVIRRGADGKCQSVAQANAAQAFDGGTRSLLLHLNGVITISGVAAGERRAVGEKGLFASSLKAIGPVEADVAPLAEQDQSALMAVLATAPAPAQAPAQAPAPAPAKA